DHRLVADAALFGEGLGNHGLEVGEEGCALAGFDGGGGDDVDHGRGWCRWAPCGKSRSSVCTHPPSTRSLPPGTPGSSLAERSSAGQEPGVPGEGCAWVLGACAWKNFP